MPLYDFACESGHEFAIVRNMSEYTGADEPCPECGVLAKRDMSKSQAQFYGAGDWNRQTFNPALGCYTKSNKHAQQIAKSRGLIEVGNEKPETIHKTFEKQRAETNANRWKEADREKLYE